MSLETRRKRTANKIDIPIENVPNNEHEELLQDYVVEKYLQSMFKPLNIMKSIFFCAIYNIRDNIITANSRSYSFISICGTILLMVVCYCLFFITRDTTGVAKFDCVINIINIYDFNLYFFGSLLSSFTSITQKFNNVLLILKIQRVHKLLKLNRRNFKRFIITNWFCVIAVNCFYCFWMCYYYLAFAALGFDDIFTSYLCIHFDMNIIYATRYIKLMGKSMKSLLQDLQKSAYTENLDVHEDWECIFRIFMEILEAFKIIEKTFHQAVLFYILHTFSNALLGIYIRIELRGIVPGSNAKYVLLSFVCLSWVIKNLILQIFLSVESERFYTILTEVKNTCIELRTSRICSETKKRVCKNIQRVEKFSFKRMNACNLFIIDAMLPLRLIGFITTYTIVLLQFEFL